jgi:signal transduction histidine kinase
MMRFSGKLSKSFRRNLNRILQSLLGQNPLEGGTPTRRIGVILAASLVIALLGACSVGWAAASDENESSAYILKPEAREELIAFVDEARDFVMEQGRDKALPIFNDPKGKFVRDGLYIIAYDFNGTCLAHPYEPQLVNTNVLNVTDVNGVALKRNMLEVARRGGGFTYYIWPNPAHSNAEELKLTYVLKVDQGLWLGAGAYLPGKAPIFSNESREDLVAFVDGARDFALNTTKDEALKAFNDKNGRFVEEKRYIFATDFAGNTLALANQPELLKTNRIDIRDPNGVEINRDMIALVQNGGGFMYYIYLDPARNMTPRLKFSYVTKVDDTWWLGAGIYA